VSLKPNCVGMALLVGGTRLETSGPVAIDIRRGGATIPAILGQSFFVVILLHLGCVGRADLFPASVC
jgi:hypothetical protein